jgi:hypothetical protein
MRCIKYATAATLAGALAPHAFPGQIPSSLGSPALYRWHGIAYLWARQAIERACCLHPSVSANRRQAASYGTGFSTRAEA